MGQCDIFFCMKKRTFTLGILVCILLVFSWTGCDTSGGGGTEVPDTATTREAYAFGDRDLDNGGWSITVPVNVSGTPVSTVIYAMDGGAYSLAVGTVEYLYDGNQLTVGYILDEGYTLDETRIYIDEFSAPERDITADQLGNVNVQPPGTRTYTYGGFAASGDPIYLIAYAVVREDFGP